jgi:hypothetical protein
VSPSEDKKQIRRKQDQVNDALKYMSAPAGKSHYAEHEGQQEQYEVGVLQS